MGTLIWQLNDCWPAISWSLIDSYLRSKAAYYHVKRAFSNRWLTLLGDSKNLELCLMNDESEGWSGFVRLKVIDLNGSICHEDKFQFQLGADRAETIHVVNPSDIQGNLSNQVIVAEIDDPADDRSIPSRATWFPQEFKNLNLLHPEISLKPEIKQDIPGVRLKSKSVSFGIWLHDPSNPNLIFTDNALDLLPGDEMWIATTHAESGEPLQSRNPKAWNI